MRPVAAVAALLVGLASGPVHAVEPFVLKDIRAERAAAEGVPR